MKHLGLLLAVCTFSLSAIPASGSGFLAPHDPLAPTDSWGRLHQSPAINDVDYAPRESWRLFYYVKSRHDLVKDPAYMGAVQVELRRRSYYCGPIDGAFSSEVIEAIARLQKNYAFPVDGHLTVQVRRALHLP